MSWTLGPILRWAGLAIEMVCLVLWLMAGSRPDAGSMTGQILFAGVAFGFVLWLMGQVLIRIEIKRTLSGSKPLSYRNSPNTRDQGPT